MRNEEVGTEIVAGAVEYASVADKSSRLTIRARIIGLIDKLALEPKPLKVRQVLESELISDTATRGALILHLDFASRSAITSSELIFTAASGRVLVAEHPDLPGFPVGITLMLPADELPVGRRDLFSRKGQGWGASKYALQYALATNPGNLGAGRALMAHARREAGNAIFMAYAPLTGLRARIIQVVDDQATWAQVASGLAAQDANTLLRQLTDLLARDTLPDFVDEPASSFLKAEAREFARGAAYRVGNFHRHLGATFLGIDDGGDPSESDSMWARAYFQY